MSKKKLKDSSLTFQGFFEMSKEEKATYEGKICLFISSSMKYIEDVVEWLRLSLWHYSEMNAREIVKNRDDWIIEYFECHAPIDLADAEAGYFCG